jgi:hypothetical protein
MGIELSERTLKALSKVITGDGGISPYRSGPQLVDFFNEFGADDVYPRGGGFPSRWAFAEDELREFNDSAKLPAIIEAAVAPPEYLGSEFEADAVVAHLNEYLQYDGFELRKAGLAFRLGRRGSAVPIEALPEAQDEVNQQFIHEQVDKCREKLAGGDFDGAITNARVLIEAVLREIETRLSPEPPATHGDLVKQYKTVQRLLQLEPGRQDLSTALKQILSGLNNIVSGLAGVSNKMGDRHARQYRPAEHHARLAVNSANTLADFLFSTFEHQRKNGRISASE